MRYAIKFAYDGTKFEGYARQPGKTTVEGNIIKAMKGLGIITTTRAANQQTASRTDRGVSAIGNVIAVDTDFAQDALCDALNSHLEGIVFHSAVAVPDDFNARHARQRWYRYFFLKDQCPPVKELKTAAKLFVGEYNFRQFSKKSTGNETTILKIDSIEFTESGDFLLVDVKAHRFLWELVRRMLAAILELANGRVEPAFVKEMLENSVIHPKGFNPLEPEFLVLMDVFYGFEFENSSDPQNYFDDETRRLKRLSKTMSQISDIISS